MTKLLEHNLASLAQNDPVLARKIREAEIPAKANVSPARTGAPTLIMDGVSLHSRFDPMGEAEVLADSPAVTEARATGGAIAVFGLGLGHHVLALAQRFSLVMVIEPNLGLIRLAFTHLDFSRVMPGLRFLTAPSSIAGQPPAVLIPHAPSVRLNRGEYNKWAKLWGRGSGGNGPETAADLLKAWNDIPGMKDILIDLDAAAPVEPAELVRAAGKRRGRLSEGEIYLFLLNELAQGL